VERCHLRVGRRRRRKRSCCSGLRGFPVTCLCVRVSFWMLLSIEWRSVFIFFVFRLFCLFWAWPCVSAEISFCNMWTSGRLILRKRQARGLDWWLAKVRGTRGMCLCLVCCVLVEDHVQEMRQGWYCLWLWGVSGDLRVFLCPHVQCMTGALSMCYRLLQIWQFFSCSNYPI
jgi:hypothetical protein